MPTIANKICDFGPHENWEAGALNRIIVGFLYSRGCMSNHVGIVFAILRPLLAEILRDNRAFVVVHILDQCAGKRLAQLLVCAHDVHVLAAK